MAKKPTIKELQSEISTLKRSNAAYKGSTSIQKSNLFKQLKNENDDLKGKLKDLVKENTKAANDLRAKRQELSDCKIQIKEQFKTIEEMKVELHESKMDFNSLERSNNNHVTEKKLLQEQLKTTNNAVEADMKTVFEISEVLSGRCTTVNLKDILDKVKELKEDIQLRIDRNKQLNLVIDRQKEELAQLKEKNAAQVGIINVKEARLKELLAFNPGNKDIDGLNCAYQFFYIFCNFVTEHTGKTYDEAKELIPLPANDGRIFERAHVAKEMLEFLAVKLNGSKISDNPFYINVCRALRQHPGIKPEKLIDLITQGFESGDEICELLGLPKDDIHEHVVAKLEMLQDDLTAARDQKDKNAREVDRLKKLNLTLQSEINKYKKPLFDFKVTHNFSKEVKSIKEIIDEVVTSVIAIHDLESSKESNMLKALRNVLDNLNIEKIKCIFIERPWSIVSLRNTYIQLRGIEGTIDFVSKLIKESTCKKITVNLRNGLAFYIKPNK